MADPFDPARNSPPNPADELRELRDESIARLLLLEQLRSVRQWDMKTILAIDLALDSAKESLRDLDENLQKELGG